MGDFKLLGIPDVEDCCILVRGLQGMVKLVDEFTGRVVEGRKWRSGLQAAVEAKEGAPIQAEGNILNAITMQHLLQQYPKIAGMTATAQPSAEEFFSFYGLR
ncbi:MAG: hypothetical protein LR011_12835, partial [Verrucomicrobia bacterium]|nr:hypothetical protein [Verrucomicrobiota bacterium]